MASKRPRSVSPRVVRSLQSFAPELADLARYELSKRGMCSSVVLCNLDDDDFVLLRRCLPDPTWSVLPHLVMETRIACKQLVRGIRQSGYTPFLSNPSLLPVHGAWWLCLTQGLDYCRKSQSSSPRWPPSRRFQTLKWLARKAIRFLLTNFARRARQVISGVMFTPCRHRTETSILHCRKSNS